MKTNKTFENENKHIQVNRNDDTKDAKPLFAMYHFQHKLFFRKIYLHNDGAHCFYCVFCGNTCFRAHEINPFDAASEETQF